MLSDITEVKEMVTRDSSKYPEWVKALKAGDPIFVDSRSSIHLTSVDHVTEHYIFIKNSQLKFPKDTQCHSTRERWSTYTHLYQDTQERRGELKRTELEGEVIHLASDIGKLNQYRGKNIEQLEFLKEHMGVVTTYMILIGGK